MPVSYTESIDSFVMSRTGGSVAGSLLSAGQLGEVIITEGNKTYTQIVKADATGHFSMNLTAAQATPFATGVYTITVNALETITPQAVLQAMASGNPQNIFTTLLAKNVGTVTTNSDVLNIDANDATKTGYSHAAYDATSRKLVFNNFNSDDRSYNGFTGVDQYVTINVGNATSVRAVFNNAHTELDLYFGNANTPNVVFKGAMNDVDGDNITLIGVNGHSANLLEGWNFGNGIQVTYSSHP
jgi:hypothetical protein